MAEPDVDVNAILAALEAQRQALTAELAGIQDQERRDEISETLWSIGQQIQHLREQGGTPTE
jgi:hypothetical protein